MIFERTIICSLHHPSSIYLRMAVSMFICQVLYTIYLVVQVSWCRIWVDFFLAPFFFGARFFFFLWVVGVGWNCATFASCGRKKLELLTSSGFCNPTLLLGLRVLQPSTPFRA